MAEHSNVTAQLVNYIRAGYPGIWMRTSEEARAVAIIQRAAIEIGKVPDCAQMNVFMWSFTEGFHGSDSGLNGEAERKPDAALALIDPRAKQHLPGDSVIVLKDFSAFLDDVGILRSVRDLMGTLKDTGSVIVFLGPVLAIKPEIEKDILTLELPLPDAGEFGDMLDNLVENNKKLKVQGDKLFSVPREKVLDGLAGLTLTEAENVLSLTIIEHATFDDPALKTIHREKASSLKKNGLLRYKESDRGMEDIGGLDLLKKWFEYRKVGFTAEARKAGLPFPKGVLLVGVQGCGKSLAAAALANMLQVPLVEGNVGDWMDSLVGGSERKTKEALATADAIGTCVLRLDEFEKMAQGSESSGRTDGGTTSRVLKEFLTWLNDRKSPVFCAATVNRIDALPAEILRKGRFDEIFFVDLPTKSERKEIARIHLKRNGLPVGTFDLDALAAASEGFSGAEIEQAVIDARYRCFTDKGPVTSEVVVEEMKGTKPLSVTMRSQIDAVRERLANVAKPASSPEPVTAASGSGRKLRT